MRLYDTATRSLRALEPRHGRIAMYVCGITPYDSAHLGHAFAYHVFDVVDRRLRSTGVEVRSVRNVTDSDDDIFRVARQRGIPHRRLVADQLTIFEREMRSIGVAHPDSVPRASAHVPAMIDWIRRLEGAGFAYAREGWVYFETARFDRYGTLSRLSREQMTALSRERGGDPDDPRKRDPLDFVLWQPSLPDELAWPSPWGAAGRPGWHIECSVLAAHELRDGVDVHGGGDDLVFPHHECEIAQAESVGAQPFARHWAHVAMVRLDGEKMSKSLGNLVFTRDLVDSAGAGATRLLLAAHHWRTPWEYDENDLHVAAARLGRYHASVEAGAGLDPEEAAALERAFLDRVDDDLDTPGALAVADRAVDSAGTRHAPDGAARVDVLLPRLLDILGAGFALGVESAVADPAAS